MNLHWFSSKTTPKQNAHPYCYSRKILFLNHGYSIYLPSFHIKTWKMQLLTLSDLSFTSSSEWKRRAMGCWKRRNRVSPESLEDVETVPGAVPDRPPTVPVDRVKEIFLCARERQEEAW